MVSLYIRFGFQDFESTLRALRIRKDELIEKEGQMKEYLQKFDNFLKVRS